MDPISTPPAADVSPDYAQIVTEDDTPVDNIPSEKQQRLLVEPLYAGRAAWANGRPFLATANVGLFYKDDQPPLVPDMLLSLDVEIAQDWWAKRNRSYFSWVFGKMPEVVVEIVSNREGGELGDKMKTYARIGIVYYVVFDPALLLGDEPLRVHGLREARYERVTEEWLPPVGLGVKLWRGAFEGKEEVWLRWCDHNGDVLPTGAEMAGEQRRLAEQERQRAEQERQRADKLAAQLRALGIEPEA